MNAEDTKLLAILRRFYEKTKTGEVPWEQGEDPNVFAVSFPSYTVAIERTPATEDDPGGIAFRISNDEGTPIVQLSAFEARTLGFGDMEEFFYAARKIALRLGEALDTLAQELEDLLHQK